MGSAILPSEHLLQKKADQKYYYWGFQLSLGQNSTSLPYLFFIIDRKDK
jgi:hypothetical protein